MSVELDLVTLEVLRNALPAVANEMAADLQRISLGQLSWSSADQGSSRFMTNRLAECPLCPR
jgi:hypothetical protein